MRSTGPANSMFFIRLSTSDTRVAASTRARFAPRQKWAPLPPNAKCGLGLRVTSKRSGSAKWASSLVGRMERVEDQTLVTNCLLALAFSLLRAGMKGDPRLSWNRICVPNTMPAEVTSQTRRQP
jgi:hypothetical protein